MHHGIGEVCASHQELRHYFSLIVMPCVSEVFVHQNCQRRNIRRYFLVICVVGFQ